MQTRVPAFAVSSNALLEIGTCPRHNRPGVRTKQLKFSTKPPMWTWLLIFIGLIVALIVQLVLRKQVAGNAYECDACIKEQRRFRLTLIVAWVLDLPLLIGTNGNDIALLLWAIFTVGLLIYSLTGARHRIQGFLTNDQTWVELKNADPGFAAAVQARMSAASPTP